MNFDAYYSYPGEPRFDCACELCIKGAAHSDAEHQASVKIEMQFKRDLRISILCRLRARVETPEMKMWLDDCIREIGKMHPIRQPDPRWYFPWSGEMFQVAGWAAPIHGNPWRAE